MACNVVEEIWQGAPLLCCTREASVQVAVRGGCSLTEQLTPNVSMLITFSLASSKSAMEGKKNSTLLVKGGRGAASTN
jgi:hypothetical protein